MCLYKQKILPYKLKIVHENFVNTERTLFRCKRKMSHDVYFKIIAEHFKMATAVVDWFKRLVQLICSLQIEKAYKILYICGLTF